MTVIQQLLAIIFDMRGFVIISPVLTNGIKMFSGNNKVFEIYAFPDGITVFEILFTDDGNGVQSITDESMKVEREMSDKISGVLT